MPQEMSELERQVFRDMTRDGCFASASLQKQSFVKWLSSGYPAGYSALAARMNHAEPMPITQDHPYSRVADALVQKLRKAGLVERQGRDWRLSDTGQQMLEHLCAPCPAEDTATC